MRSAMQSADWSAAISAAEAWRHNGGRDWRITLNQAVCASRIRHGPENTWLELVQEAMRRQLKGDPSAPRSAIRVHLTLEGLIGAAQATLCPFNALRSARIICRTKEAKDHWEWLIEAGRAEEFQDPTREPEPAVLLIDELQQQQFQEIFLAPDIDPRTTSKEELMRAVSAARVGLHLIKQPTQG